LIQETEKLPIPFLWIWKTGAKTFQVDIHRKLSNYLFLSYVFGKQVPVEFLSICEAVVDHFLMVLGNNWPDISSEYWIASTNSIPMDLGKEMRAIA
jgi:hypothetical protein